MRRYFFLACAACVAAGGFAAADSRLEPRAPPKAAFARRTDIGPTAAKAILQQHTVATIAPKRGPVDDTAHVHAVRGGAAGDSDAVRFSKISFGVVLEASALLGVLLGGKALSSLPALAKILPQQMQQIGGLHPIQWASFALVIFASSLVGSFIDGGLSAASNQVFDPNATPGDPHWYASLNRPRWEPPGWVFPIMWLLVSKPTQLYAVSRLFLKATEDSDDGATLVRALAVYCTHLSLGDTWNKVFFGSQCPGKGAIVITTFFAVLAASAALFWSIDDTAGLFMLPTCAWVVVASALNWSIYLNN